MNNILHLANIGVWFCLFGTLWGAEPAKPQPAIQVVAHRGLLLHAPENTLANFTACLELKLGFEVDVRRSKDDYLVCVHDDTVDRTTNGTGAIHEKTLAELKQLDAGSWFDEKFSGQRIPTMAEVFALIAKYPPPTSLIAIDIKGSDKQIERDLVVLAQQYQVLGRLLFIGRTIQTPDVRQRLQAASAEAQVAAVANTAEEFPTALADKTARWVYVRFLPTAAQVSQAHQQKKPVFIAGPTVSGHLPVNWQAAIESGLDGILTDHPLELSQLLRQPRGRSAP